MAQQQAAAEQKQLEAALEEQRLAAAGHAAAAQAAAAAARDEAEEAAGLERARHAAELQRLREQHIAELAAVQVRGGRMRLHSQGGSSMQVAVSPRTPCGSSSPTHTCIGAGAVGCGTCGSRAGARCPAGGVAGAAPGHEPREHAAGGAPRQPLAEGAASLLLTLEPGGTAHAAAAQPPAHGTWAADGAALGRGGWAVLGEAARGAAAAAEQAPCVIVGHSLTVLPTQQCKHCSSRERQSVQTKSRGVLLQHVLRAVGLRGISVLRCAVVC